MTETAGTYITTNFKPPKRIKINGEHKSQLDIHVYERDMGRCIICNQIVDLGYPSHHCLYKSELGDDTADNRATICQSCDFLLHHSDPNKLVEKIRDNYKSKDIVQCFLLGRVKILEGRK